MFIVAKERGYVFLPVLEATKHLAKEKIEEHYNGWKLV